MHKYILFINVEWSTVDGYELQLCMNDWANTQHNISQCCVYFYKSFLVVCFFFFVFISLTLAGFFLWFLWSVSKRNIRNAYKRRHMRVHTQQLCVQMGMLVSMKDTYIYISSSVCHVFFRPYALLFLCLAYTYKRTHAHMLHELNGKLNYYIQKEMKNQNWWRKTHTNTC